MMHSISRVASRGFTLIELLVVITILAILAGAALPYVQAYVEESRVSKAKADLEEISKALVVYETREGPYQAGDVGQLTGRYLNKAPIDPWGQPYFVATASGIAYSCGPDRLPFTPDDIVVAYIPPLALVRVEWVDANQSGSVDSQNTPDFLQFSFSRMVSSASRIISNPALAYADFSFTGTTTWNLAFNWAGLETMIGSRTFRLSLQPGVSRVFVGGSDTVRVVSNNDIFDTARIRNRCLSDQGVIIRAR